jgi:hypothetical protein
MSARREARLKREFADQYPGLSPDVWYSAAWLSARQFARTKCDGVAAEIAAVLNDQHFEFRGGRPRRLRDRSAGDVEPTGSEVEGEHVDS